jgi:hypothetical protein
MDLSFTITASPLQRNHSQVRVSRDTLPHITNSDSRHLQPGGSHPCIYIPQALGSLFVASYDSQGYGGGIRSHLHTGSCHITSERTDRENNFNPISKEMFVDHPYLRKRRSVTGGFPRMRVSVNVFADSFPSNGSTCHDIHYVCI